MLNFPHCADTKSLDYWNGLVTKVLKIHKNLESLKISVSDDQVPHRIRHENNSKYSLSPNIMDILEKKQNLKVLQLKGLMIKNEIGMQICRMRNLKFLHLSYDDRAIVSPYFVDLIADNLNQLETIEIFTGEYSDDYDGIKFRSAFNNLFRNNCKTLKKINVRIMPYFCRSLEMKFYQPECVTLKSLDLCQNLEEFRGPAHGHDLKLICESQILKKLELKDITQHNLEDILSHGMSLPNLKHLAIKTEQIFIKSMFVQVSEQYLPTLERLYISSEKIFSHYTRLDLETLEELLENFPTLKSLQIDGDYITAIDVPNECLTDIFRDYGIFIIFGKVMEIEMCDRQKNFEDFLEQDPLLLGKYYKEKRNFAKWCENNIGYGY